MNKRSDQNRFPVFIFLFFFFCIPDSDAQNQDSILREATLQNIIEYALKRQPAVQQSLNEEKITDLQIRSKLSEWYPQVNFNYLYQHNFQVVTNIIGGNTVRFGVNNTSSFQFSASQAIFNRDVLLANRTKYDVRQLTKQQTENIKIDLVAEVSKAFYDVLATDQQVRVADANIIRLQKSLHDAHARFDAGIADKTDYKRAAIALNNMTASRKTYSDALNAKNDYLKALINYPGTEKINIVYDSTDLMNEIALDTLQEPDYTKRIEYRVLETQRKLEEATVKYNKWSYLPAFSANGAYNLNYLNNDLGKLYSRSFPNSYAGLTMAFPIFQGGKRKYETEQAEWQLKNTDLQLVKLKNAIISEYSAALALYKGNLANFSAVKENVILAQDVYDVINLQYNSGIKSYLEVVAAETDLQSARINFFNALYQVLSSKIDVQKSLGQLTY
jgi:outer membrane protein TolC